MSDIKNEGLVVFVDIAGSTQLYESLGDQAAYSKISTCLARLGHIIACYDGVVIKHIGDEVLCFFGNVVAGLRAVIVAQVEMCRENGEVALPIRIGCYYGPVLIRNDDIFGDTVNIAARLSSLAQANQILTSESTLFQYENANLTLKEKYQAHTHLQFDQPLQHRFLTEFAPKGKQTQIPVHILRWEAFLDLDEAESDWTYVQPLSQMPQSRAPQVFILEVNGYRYRLDESKKILRIGRSEDMDVQVLNRNVSRCHGVFKLIAGQVQYTDQSSNGSYLRLEQSGEQYIHRESTFLTGAGVLSFGAPLIHLPRNARPEIVLKAADSAQFNFWFES